MDMDKSTATDAYGGELGFPLLDELALTAARGRGNVTAYLQSQQIGRLGPLMELVLLDRSGLLPLSAVPQCPVLRSLKDALSPASNLRGAYFSDSAAAYGFIATGRDIDKLESVEELHWVGFRQKAQQAAERCLPKAVAHGLIGAMTELEENVHLHSGRHADGMVGFRGHTDEFEFVVADSGLGMLASLRRSPDYQHVVDTGAALRLALEDGQSRLSHLEPGHGYGFRDLFRNLAKLNGSLRFRSDDQTITMEGIGAERDKSELRQKAKLQGFAASILCRPLAR